MHRPKPATADTSALPIGAWVVLLVLAQGAAPRLARAQDDTSSSPANQVWVNANLGKRFSERTFGRLDIEPKWQVSGDEPWRSLDVTPRVEGYPLEWLDLLAETEVGATKQDDDQDTLEITPRIGVTWHMFARMAPLRGEATGHEPRLSLTRLHLSTLIRLEWRNLFYSDDTPDSHEWRARFRLGGELAVNHGSLAQEHTVYALGDAEYYLPLWGDVSERYVNKVRIRMGLGYRVSRATQIEVLLVRDWNRDSPDGVKSEDVRAVDLNVTHSF